MNPAETCKEKFVKVEIILDHHLDIIIRFFEVSRVQAGPDSTVEPVVFTWRVINVTWAPCLPTLLGDKNATSLCSKNISTLNHIEGTYFWWVLAIWNHSAIPQKLAACGATARAHSGRAGGRAGSSGNINDSPGEDYRLYSRICCHLTNFFKRARPLNFENLNNDVQVVVWNINNGA